MMIDHPLGFTVSVALYIALVCVIIYMGSGGHYRLSEKQNLLAFFAWCAACVFDVWLYVWAVG